MGKAEYMAGGGGGGSSTGHATTIDHFHEKLLRLKASRLNLGPEP